MTPPPPRPAVPLAVVLGVDAVGEVLVALAGQLHVVAALRVVPLPVLLNLNNKIMSQNKLRKIFGTKIL